MQNRAQSSGALAPFKEFPQFVFQAREIAPPVLHADHWGQAFPLEGQGVELLPAGEVQSQHHPGPVDELPGADIPFAS
jgi:hypothetical protein